MAYTVAAGTYSGTTQAAADAQATADIAANGQSYANTNGSCATVYARLEYSNYSYIDNLGQTPSYILETSDVHIRLYSDAACTTPYVASAAFNLNLRLCSTKTTNSGTIPQTIEDVVG